MYPILLICLSPLSELIVASFPHELLLPGFPPVPNPILESQEAQSFCWLLMIPILTLELLGLPPTALNPSLLQFFCKEASEPISDFHLSRPSDRVWLIHWLFWRKHEIFLQNETLYPSDTRIKCTLCTALNIVLWDHVNINCTKILKADTKQPWKM